MAETVGGMWSNVGNSVDIEALEVGLSVADTADKGSESGDTHELTPHHGRS